MFRSVLCLLLGATGTGTGTGAAAGAAVGVMCSFDGTLLPLLLLPPLLPLPPVPKSLLLGAVCGAVTTTGVALTSAD